MEHSVLFFDIDGTLLSEKTGEIPQSALKALTEAQKNGHLLFINTGRTICSLPAEIRRYSFDGFLCGCGTGIYCHGEELFASSIPRERGRALIEMAEKCKIGAVAEGKDDVYFPERISRFVPLETTRRYFRTRGMGMECPIERDAFIFDKMFIYTDDQSDLARFIQYLGDDMDAMNRGDGTYEVIQKGYSKATACKFVMDRFGFTMDQVYVFGDSSNDMSMFEFAVHAVAMGSHDPVLDPYAEFVTGEVENDGIAAAMKHYKLI